MRLKVGLRPKFRWARLPPRLHVVQRLHGTIVSSVFSVIEWVIGRSPTVLGAAFAARNLAAAASNSQLVELAWPACHCRRSCLCIP